MDGIYEWIMSSPANTFIASNVSCNYSSGGDISGNLEGGRYQLIGFRGVNYATVIAMSYWTKNPILTANIENGVWKNRFIKIITSSDLGIVIKNSGTVAAVANADVQIATITLPPHHKYLILAHTHVNKGDNNAIMNCGIKKISGTVSSSFGAEDARTIMGSGGGCTAWGIVDTATSCVYGVFGYGYSSMVYNYIGDICAIQLS